MNLSLKQRKLITSLHQKKYRNLHKLFIVEGKKAIDEFLEAKFKLHQLFSTSKEIFPKQNTELISHTDLKKLSSLVTPNKALAIFEIPLPKEIYSKGLVVALDSIKDPGNLGTIIRLCDWFGIETLLCSKDTVDCYNPKVVQASMGSLSRVNLFYVDLVATLIKMEDPIVIADMNGENVYVSKLPKEGILVMGNESNGVSKDVKALAKYVVSIPRFGSIKKTESLNVATATSILLSEFKRGK